MLIYRHWAIMAHSEKLSDIIALGKYDVHYTKNQYSFYIIISSSKSTGIVRESDYSPAAVLFVQEKGQVLI